MVELTVNKSKRISLFCCELLQQPAVQQHKTKAAQEKEAETNEI